MIHAAVEVPCDAEPMVKPVGTLALMVQGEGFHNLKI